MSRAVAVAGLLLVTSAAPLLAQTRHVLILYGERSALPGIQIVDAGLSAELERRLGPDLQLYREDLDVSRFDDADHVDAFTAYLVAKYSDVPIDAIVPVMEPAVDAAIRLRDLAFSDRVPIVFWRLGASPPPVLAENVTGAYVHPPFAATLTLALELHPETERVVVVAGESRFDRDIRRYAQAELRSFADRLDISYPRAAGLDSLEAMLADLEPGTIVLYGTILRDGANRPRVAREAAEEIGAASAVPVYGISDLFLEHGIVGGRMHELEGDGEVVGELVAVALESGELPPPVDLPSGAAMFDHWQLGRWGIATDRLPSDAVIVSTERSWLARNWIIVATVAGMLLEGAIIAGLLVARRQRRRAEARLRENEQRFRTLADRVPVMIWMTGSDDRFIFLNRTWLDFSGTSLGDELEDRWTDRAHPQDRNAGTEALARSKDTGDPFSIECRLRRHDGTWRWVLCTGVPRLAADGEYLGHIGTCLDITRRKRAELEGQRHAEDLARVSRVATMGAFSASIAHELNQPLTAILSNAEASIRFLDRPDPNLGEVRDTLTDIAEAGRRAGEIIRRMRRLIERHEVSRVDLDLNTVVGEVLQLVRLEAQARRVDLEFEPGGLEIPVSGDRIHIQQVLINLVLNGFEAMEEVPKDRRRLVIVTGNGDGFATVSVRDAGPGIPGHVLPHLFEPLNSTKQHGLGMGLSISRTIVEAHGGEIRAENSPHGGATFHVTLPID